MKKVEAYIVEHNLIKECTIDFNTLLPTDNSVVYALSPKIRISLVNEAL